MPCQILSQEAIAELPKVAIIGGTGRIGAHLAATWASAGIHVTICSRSAEKAQALVDEVISGKGYNKDQIQIPRCDTEGWKLKGGGYELAAEADMIVLACAPFEVQWPALKKIANSIRGKGKVIIDLCNPWIMGRGIPPDQPQASVLVHKMRLNDPTVKWGVAYKTIMWPRIVPAAKGVGVEVCGDPEAVDMISRCIIAHGFQPMPMGALEVAADMESGFRGQSFVRVKTGLPFKEFSL